MAGGKCLVDSLFTQSWLSLIPKCFEQAPKIKLPWHFFEQRHSMESKVEARYTDMNKYRKSRKKFVNKLFKIGKEGKKRKSLIKERGY